MIKILIVDDDALTRKGIRMLMPWQKYQMEIISEASNGQEALDFLLNQSVDLVLVDLDMPIMDGVTFIRESKALYPTLHYVVLTIHTEFRYIQEALRLGAIDYIAKTQFDKENFDQILERINTSIAKRALSLQINPDVKWREHKILYPYIYALITIHPDNEEHIFLFFKQNNLSVEKDIHEIMSGVWVFTHDKTEFLFPEFFPDTTLMQIFDVSELTYNDLRILLRHYLNDQFFYDYQPLKKINRKRAYELREDEFITDEETLNTLKSVWISLNWVHENDLFDKIKVNLMKSRLKFSTLYHLLLNLENVWNTAYSQLTGFTLSLPSAFHNWEEVENWLSEAYEKANLFINNSKYSDEITRQILNAKHFVDTHYNLPINTTEVARNANMSYGYFSRCFHELLGITFSDYYTSVRISRAKELLKATGKSIQQISLETGYNDEKYFSRLFKKHIGYSPSEYRNLVQ